MKKIFFLLIYFLVIVVTLNSCTRTVDINSNLVGQWQWAFSYGGFAVQKINSSPNIVILNFNSDSTYTYMENGVLKSNDRYHITRIDPNNVVLNLTNLNYSKLWLSPNGEILSIKNDTLTMTDYMISDGYSHYFKRVK